MTSFMKLVQALRAETEQSGNTIGWPAIRRIVSSLGGDKNLPIEVGTLLSALEGRGRVELSINGEVAQMDVAKAREVTRMLQEATEAAISDELIVRFFVEELGQEKMAAVAMLGKFRRLRQGSEGVVWPM